MNTSGRVAFYGTLRQREPGYHQLQLERKLRFLGMCSIPGVLYDLGDYPALFNGDGVVVAELFALSNESLMSHLDEFEGYDPANPTSSLFVRRETKLAGGEGVAWVYFYGESDRPPARAKRIVTGDWVRRR